MTGENMDTAQPFAAAETDRASALDNAADAFKAFTTGEPVVQPRDDSGRFAAPEPDEYEAEYEAGEPVDDEAYMEDGEEAAETAQPMPPSWPADQAEYWQALPPETQAFVAEREGERERAVQAKFQESANARKEAQALQEAANASRNEYAQMLDVLANAIQPVEPDPRAYGAGTGQYNREAYDLALVEYREQANTLAQLQQQREAIRQEQDRTEQEQFSAWKQEHEAQFAPKLLADVPELTDPVRAEPLVRDLVNFAIAAGIPAEVFAPEAQDQITSAQLHLIWKAQQFDKLRTTAPAAKKPASPAVKPGVSSPRSAARNAQRNQAYDRLAREGSVEAGAAIFKQMFSKR